MANIDTDLKVNMAQNSSQATHKSHQAVADFVLNKYHVGQNDLKKAIKFSACKKLKANTDLDYAEKLAKTMDLDSIFTCIERKMYTPKGTTQYKKFQTRFLLNTEEINKIGFPQNICAVIFGFEKAIRNVTREIKPAADDNLVLKIAPADSNKIEANKPIVLTRCMADPDYDLSRFYEKMFIVQQSNSFFDLSQPLEMTIYVLTKPTVAGYPKRAIEEVDDDEDLTQFFDWGKCC